MKSLKILYSPRNVYKDILANDVSWGLDYVILSLLLIIIAIFAFPINEQILHNNKLMNSFSSSQIDMINFIQSKIKYIVIISEPVNLLIRSLVFSLLIYLTCLLLKCRVKYDKIFCLVIISYSIILLSKIANMSILYFKGVTNIKTIFDINPIGLGAFFSVNDIGYFLYSFLSSINFFEIWFIVITIYGISDIVKIAKRKASIIILSSWLVITLFNVVRLVIPYNLTLHN